MAFVSAMNVPLSRRRLLQSLPLTALASSFHIHVRSQEAKRSWITGNPAIDKPREVAINLLKPTQAQIEHAWELHFGSVVFESYGFAPRCAIDAEAMNEAIKAGASAGEIADLRESMGDEPQRDERARAQGVPRRLPCGGRDLHFPKHRRGRQRPDAPDQTSRAFHQGNGFDEASTVESGHR
jgi:hypothetical protein